MKEFRALLEELTEGRTSLGDVREWLRGALRDGTVSSDDVLAGISEARNQGLPEPAARTLRSQIDAWLADQDAEGTETVFRLAEEDTRTGRTPSDPPDADEDGDEGLSLSLDPIDESDAGAESDDAAAGAEQNREEESSPGAPGGEAQPGTSATDNSEDEHITLTGDRAETTGGSGKDTSPPTEVDDASREGDAPADHPMFEPTEFAGEDEGETHIRGDEDEAEAPTGKSRRKKHGNIGPGTVLKDRFELVETIGSGGMGTVYKARDLLKVEAQDRNPYMALKLLSGDFREHPEAFIALQRESSKAQKLAHPNIATVYDFDRDGSTVYMTMELMEGEELARFIKKLPPGGLPVDRAMKLIEQLCAGLAYAHKRNLVHSDFKPGNAYVTRDGTVKLLDFGIARASKTHKTASGETTVFDPMSLGALTPAYATVEMFEGEPPDPRDDIYGLACVAYELLSGRHPFNKLSAVKVKEKGLTPSPIAKLNKRQNQALFKALALNREDRISSVEAFWEQLRPKKNHAPLIATGVSALLVLIGALAYNPVRDYLQSTHNAEVVARLEQGGPDTVRSILAALDDYQPESRQAILEGARDRVIRYFEQRAEEKVNTSEGDYDFPGALETIRRAQEHYPDSAQLAEIEQSLVNRRNSLVADLTEDFNRYLDEGRLLPASGENDITNVLDILSEAEPDNTLLSDPRLATAYADLARQAIEGDDYERAREILDIGLEYLPENAQLANLDDRVQDELQRRANARRVEGIHQQLDELGDRLADIGVARGVIDELIDLEQLRPDGDRLASARDRIREQLDNRLTRLAENGDWTTAEDDLTTFAPVMEADWLLEKRRWLNRQEVDAGFQPERITRRLSEIENLRERLSGLELQSPFTREEHMAVLTDYRRLTALLRPGHSWFPDLRNELVDAYLARARDLMEAERFDAARRLAGNAREFRHGGDRVSATLNQISNRAAEWEARQAAQLRKARLEGLKNQLTAQARAGEVAAAIETFEQLREEAPPEDEFLERAGPGIIADAYLRLARSRAETDDFEDAARLATAGLDIAPERDDLAEAQGRYRAQAERVEMITRAGGADADDVDWLASRLESVVDKLPEERSTIRNSLVEALKQRIRELESGNLRAAHRLRDTAVGKLPATGPLENLRLEALPAPSKYGDTLGEAIEAGELTRAESVLAQARDTEPDHPRIKELAGRLADARDEANQYFLEYQQLMRLNQRDQARIYLEEALERWTDNDRFREELRQNFVSSGAPARSEDGSKPCTSRLAGYGRRGRAECFDMIRPDTKGPTLVVVPAGGGRRAPFAIGKYEISRDELNHYCRQTDACSTLEGDPALPATGIPFEIAEGYTDWLSDRTNQDYRIPTESEWEHAARADNPDAVADFNCRVTLGGDTVKGLSLLSVETGKANPWGLMNFVGNAREWVRADGSLRVRGGSFRESHSNCGVSLARPHDGGADPVTGFRVARAID